MSQFQHFVQQRYLSQWTTPNGKLNVFSTADRKPIRGRSHRNSCGALDWQPPEFEIAFNNIEQKIQTVKAFRDLAVSHGYDPDGYTPKDGLSTRKYLKTYGTNYPLPSDAEVQKFLKLIKCNCSK